MKPIQHCVYFFLTSLLLLAACKKEQPVAEKPIAQTSGDDVTFPANAPQLASIAVAPVAQQTEPGITLYGRLAWNDDVTVRIFSPVAGRVLRITAGLNQSVKTNDVLAELDSPDFGQALADVRTATGNSALAEKAYARAQALLAHGAAAQKDVETAESALISARAEKERSLSRLANYGATPNTTNNVYLLHSPITGLLVEKNISPGEEIRADLMLANAPQFFAPLFTVTDPSRLWLFLDVDDATAAALSAHAEVTVHSKAYPEKTFHGRLETVGHALDPATRTVKTLCTVENPDNMLRAEMYVTADVAADAAKVLNIPTAAIFLKDDGYFVFVELAPGHFQRHAIKAGPESQGRTAVLSGLQSGERIVTEGCLLLEALLEGDNS